MEIRQAERKQAKIKMGLQGPSGSGKTYSALLLAYGLTQDWTKIVVIDSEQHSSDLYAHLGNYNVLHLEQPFSPERYFEAIELCEDAKMEVIIIDSISHEWDGSGGILDIHGNMTGNSFTNWSKVTPRHNAFVQKILQCNCHVIATIRSKQDYILTEKNGKQVPEKVGMKGVTRDGMDYELTLVFELDLKHNAIATKDRTGLFMDKPHFIISTVTGTAIKDWCSQGTSLDDVLAEIKSCESVERLRRIWLEHPTYRKVLEPIMVKRKEEILDEKSAFIEELNS
jgi:hypothetical protein